MPPPASISLSAGGWGVTTAFERAQRTAAGESL
jgi:hypothetical protein